MGGLQYLALRRIYPTLSMGRWILYTSILAVAGWAIGSAIPIFGEFSDTATEPYDPPVVPLAMASAAMGAGLGVMFGFVQRFALRAAATDTHWWVVANAMGWALALPLIYVAASLGGPDDPISAYIGAGLVAGLGAGLVLGLVTGLSFWKMEPRA